MAKRLLVLGIMVGLAITAVYASPMGPVRPAMGRFGLEFEAASESRKMDISGNGTNTTNRKVESVLLLGRGTYGLTDRIELTARLGAADLDGRDMTAAAVKIGSNYRFAWGIGIGGILYDAGNWNLAAQGNYFAHTGHEPKAPYNTTSGKMKFWDYNIGLQVQGKFDQFLPYVGVKYSSARVDYSNINGENYKDEANKNVGVYCGAGVEFAPQWSGYIEGRFVDETSFGGGIRYTF